MNKDPGVFNFSWRVATVGYRWSKSYQDMECAILANEHTIVPEEGIHYRYLTTYPLKKNPMLFKRFSNLKNPEMRLFMKAVLDFCNKYGPLLISRSSISENEVFTKEFGPISFPAEPISLWKKEVDHLNALLGLHKAMTGESSYEELIHSFSVKNNAIIYTQPKRSKKYSPWIYHVCSFSKNPDLFQRLTENYSEALNESQKYEYHSLWAREMIRCVVREHLKGRFDVNPVWEDLPIKSSYPGISVIPNCLIGGIWLQFYLHIMKTQIHYTYCLSCHTPILLNAGRRKSRKFCDSTCRSRYHRSLSCS